MQYLICVQEYFFAGLVLSLRDYSVFVSTVGISQGDYAVELISR